MPTKRVKIFLGAVLFFVMLAGSCGFVLAAGQDIVKKSAFEQVYPKLPLVGEFSWGQPLDFYLKYFLHLAFYLAAAVAAGVLIWGGFLYLISSNWPNNLVKARVMINRALLGLAIILSSYLLLITINPSLLLFQTPKIIQPEPSILEEIKPQQGEVIFTHAAGLRVCEQTIKELTKQATARNEQGQNVLLTVNQEDINKTDKDQEPMMEAEQPFYDTYQFLQEAVKIGELIQKEAKDCACGIVQVNITKDGCLPGMSKEDEAIARRRWEGQGLAKYVQDCLTQCNNCLQSGCDQKKLKELRKQLADLLGDNKQQAAPQAPEQIKTLKSQTAKFALERFKNLQQILSQNANEYFINNAEEGFFQTDFQTEQQRLVEAGVKVTIKEEPVLLPNEPAQPAPTNPPANSTASQSSGFLAKIPGYFQSFLGLIVGQPKEVKALTETVSDLVNGNPMAANYTFEPTNLFAVIDASGPAVGVFYAPSTIQNNQEVLQNANRANFTAVILQMSLEELQGIFQRCLASAFGSAGFNITEKEVEEVIKLALQQIDGQILNTLMGRKDELAAVFGQEFKAGVNAAFGDKWTETVIKCDNKCVEWCLGKEDKGCYEPCHENCLIPPANWLSNVVAGYLSKNIKSMLPSEIKKILDSRVRDVIFGDFNKTLDQDVINLTGTVVHNVLTQSFVESVPQLRKALNTKLSDIEFLNFATKILTKIDEFVASSTTGMLANLESDYQKLKQEGIDGVIGKTLGDSAANALTGDFKQEHPELFLEYDIANCPSLVFEAGRTLMVMKQDPDNRRQVCLMNVSWTEDSLQKNNVQCAKLTAQEINGLQKVPNKVELQNSQITEETKAQDLKVSLSCKPVDDSARQTICHGAGYCWGSTKDNPRGDEICQECEYLRVNSTGSFKEDLGKAERSFVAGTVNFFEGLMSAFIQTAFHAAVKYAQVLVEDELLTPLRPFIMQVAGWQQDLHKLLTEGTIADVLPKSVTNILNSSPDKLMQELCNKYKNKQPLTIAPAIDWNGIQWNDQGLSSKAITTNDSQTLKTVTEKAGQASCYIEKHLHSQLIDEINSLDQHCKKLRQTNPGAQCQDLKGYLNSTVEDLLPDNWQEYLDKPIAELAFGNAAALAKGNLKQIVRGELLQWNLMPKLKTEQQSLDSFCQTIKQGGVSSLSPNDLAVLRGKNVRDRRAKLQQKGMGLLPAVNKESLSNFLNSLRQQLAASGVAAEDIDKQVEKVNTWTVPMCYFNYYACHNPIPQTKPMGGTIAEILSLGCDIVEARVASQGMNCSQWQSFKPNQQQANFWNDWQGPCQTCDLMRNHTGAYLLIYGFIANTYGVHSQKTSAEKNAFEWLGAAFPLWRNDISQVASERGISFKIYDNLQGLPQDVQTAGKVITTWFTTHQTIADAITDIPLGVIKPFEKNEASLLKEKGRGASREFLNQTPYAFLHDDVCAKIKADYSKEHPKFTLEAIMVSKLAGLPQDALPYSMASLQKVTVSDGFNALAQLDTPEISPEEQYSYLTCAALDYSLGQILGVSETLDFYVRPPEFRILFDLIHQELLPSEMPKALSSFLDMLYSQTPISVLRKIGYSIKQNNGRFLIFSVDYDKWKAQNVEAKNSYRQAFNSGVVSGTDLQGLLSAQGVGSENNGEVALVTAINKSSRPKTETEKKSNLVNIWSIPNTKYELLQYENSFEVYLYPSVSGDLVVALADFLDTRLGSLIAKKYNLRLIDYLLGQENAKKRFEIAGWDSLQNQFNKSLLQIIAEKLPDPLFGPPDGNNWADPNISLMAILADKTFVFGRPWLDLVFGPVEKTIAKGYFKAKIVDDKVNGAVNKAVSKAQTAIQDGFDKAFLDAPNWLWQKIASLWPEKLQSNFSDQAAGACYELKSTQSSTDCKEGEVFRQNGQKKECCSLGAPMVCSPRCRPKEAGKQCLIEKGETSETNRTTGRVECCFNSCRECRLANAREILGKKCSRSGDKFVSEDVNYLCCHSRSLLDDVQNGQKIGERCCVSVTECVTGQFTDSLSILAQMIANNSVPVRTLMDLPPKE
jgi:hypothetical protein